MRKNGVLLSLLVSAIKTAALDEQTAAAFFFLLNDAESVVTAVAEVDVDCSCGCRGVVDPRTR